MARKRITETEIKYQSWDEVDGALKELCTIERETGLINAAMNEAIDAAKAKADAQIKPLTERAARMERGIADYAAEHREDMGRLKSKRLGFGTVYFRKSTKLKLPTAPDKVRAIIDRLRARGMMGCIIQPEAKVNKEMLKTYDADVIAEVGGTLEISEKISYELDTAKLE